MRRFRPSGRLAIDARLKPLVSITNPLFPNTLSHGRFRSLTERFAESLPMAATPSLNPRQGAHIADLVQQEDALHR